MRKPDFAAFNTTGKDIKPLTSSMDDMPTIEKPKKASKKEQPKESTTVPRNPGTGVPSEARRVIKRRYPFDIYEDQLSALKKLSINDKLEGGVGSVSAMIRDAIDSYLKLKEK